MIDCVLLWLQADETEQCPLKKPTSEEPLILFLIDIKTLRCVWFTTSLQSVYQLSIWRLYHICAVFNRVTMTAMGSQDNILMAKLAPEGQCLQQLQIDLVFYLSLQLCRHHIYCINDNKPPILWLMLCLYLYLCPVGQRKTREASKDGAKPSDAKPQDQSNHTEKDVEPVDQKTDQSKGEDQFNVRSVSASVSICVICSCNQYLFGFSFSWGRPRSWC